MNTRLVLSLAAAAVFALSASAQVFYGTDDFNDNTFIVDAADFRLGNGVSAIPEPSTYAAIAGAAMLGLAVWQRRRGKTATATATAAV